MTGTSDRWTAYFPPGARVLALPNWRNPRLYLPAQHPLQRWEYSSFYPASLLGARLYRFSLRLGAATGVMKARTVCSDGWPLGDFVRDTMPELSSAVVLVGTPGPAQELTAQLRDEKGRVLGYLKHAEKDAARGRLRQERSMLHSLPVGVGPEPVKFGPLGDGEALLKSALPGKPPAATLPPPRSVVGLVDSLIIRPPVPLEAHPWVRRVQSMHERGTLGSCACFEPLTGRDWPIVIQHGDFAPWNLLSGGPDGALRAIDWEYGTPEGFPYLDLVHYILQTAALIYRWPPSKAARYAATYLTQLPGPALSDAEADALTRLAACHAYSESLQDGQPASAFLQSWRRAIWHSDGFSGA